MSSDCISVYARVRPSEQPSPNLSLLPSSLELAVPRAEQDVDSYSFKFAHVFGPESSQQQVFDRVAKDLVLGALDGVNSSIFAYGQTGSGKTFTMCGGKANYMRDRGIIPRTVGALFAAIDARDDDVHYSVSMSMIEIYKEIGSDLLAKSQNSRTKSAVTVSLVKGDQPVLIGAKRVALASEEDGLQQYCIGEVNRTVASTSHNQQSSRSHCIVTIFIEASDPGAQVVRTSKIQIVDLAGSERLKPYEKGSQETRGLMKEAVSINLSLHHLSVVIAALNSHSKLIPYRNSFLTRLLKDALGGNARAAMVMTVDPGDAAMPETIASCRFAQRVANVKTNAKVNEERDPQLVIAELKRRNAELETAAAGLAGVAQKENEVPDDELRRRIRAFLEDDRGGSEGGSSLRVGPMPHGAFAAFRVFRELFWNNLRDRASPRHDSDDGLSDGGPSDLQHDPPLRRPADMAIPSSSSAVLCKGCGSKVENGPDAEAVDLSRQSLLSECQAECRMLRAALAAQPAPRPSKKATGVRSSREAKLQADLTAAKGECKRLRSALAAFAKTGQAAPSTKSRPKAKPKSTVKRPGSADRRSRSLQSGTAFGGGSVGFSAEDIVVDPFKRGRAMESSTATPMRSSFGSTASAARPPTASTTYSSAAPSPAPGRISELRRANSPAPRLPGHGSSTQSSQRSISMDTVNPSASQAGSPATSLAEPLPPPQRALVGPSEAWLRATSALTEEELARCGSDAETYQVFLERDPRAGDIWQAELQRLMAERRRVEAEAKSLGEEVNQTKGAMTKVQDSLEALKSRLREFEEQAAVDSAARSKADNLRSLIVVEEPRLELLLEEKRQSLETGCSRLKDLRREHIHVQHAQKQLQATVQAEFQHWRKAVERRYPLEVAAATAALAAAHEEEATEEEAADASTSWAAPPRPLMR